jgi:hypothetical protein
VPADRPEQKKSKHDRSDVFAPDNAPPSSRALRNQPEKGKQLGFDFARDPLNAMRPMQTFEEIMKEDAESAGRAPPRASRTRARAHDRRRPQRDDPGCGPKAGRGRPCADGPQLRGAPVAWGRFPRRRPSGRSAWA